MGCKVKVLNAELNPLFGGASPEPSEPNLKDLMLEVKNSGANLGLATDGDGDRFGIIDADGTYITPNQVITLALEHLASTKASRGSEVVRTVAQPIW